MVGSWIGELYESHGPVVFRRARRLLASDEAAWDALQEIFMRVVRHAGRFRREASPTTWLYRITTNYCLNVLRDAARRQEKLEAMARDTPDGARRADPELRLALAALMLRLPEALCEIAIYHHLDRMTQDEIAGVTGLSRRTVGNRLKEFQDLAQAALGPATEALT
jgi:RNA polymerase sigma-70 factor (ECF subfamily)